jgi:hypothetical protein
MYIVVVRVELRSSVILASNSIFGENHKKLSFRVPDGESGAGVTSLN